MRVKFEFLTDSEKNARIFGMLIGYFKGDEDKAEQWLGTFNPALGDSPINFIRIKRHDTVAKFIMDSMLGNYP